MPEDPGAAPMPATSPQSAPQSPSASKPIDIRHEATELYASRFAEIVRYCQRVLGHGNKASQRELSAALEVAPTMTTRYLSGAADFRNLKAVTVERLALAAQLEPGALFAWIREGRDAAMAYQQRMETAPRAFEPLDLARQLVAMLEDTADQAAASRDPEPDYGALAAAIADQRSTGPALFDRLVALADAHVTLINIADHQPLTDDDWLKLQQLLDAPPEQLRRRFGFDQTTPRIDEPSA